MLCSATYRRHKSSQGRSLTTLCGPCFPFFLFCTRTDEGCSRVESRAAPGDPDKAALFVAFSFSAQVSLRLLLHPSLSNPRLLFDRYRRGQTNKTKRSTRSSLARSRASPSTQGMFQSCESGEAPSRSRDHQRLLKPRIKTHSSH